MTDGTAPDDDTGATGGGSRRGEGRDGAGDEHDDAVDEHDDAGDVRGDAEDADGESDHLADVEDGAGCTEIWERLSERREG
jgi:hypothetical protein